MNNYAKQTYSEQCHTNLKTKFFAFLQCHELLPHVPTGKMII